MRRRRRINEKQDYKNEDDACNKHWAENHFITTKFVSLFHLSSSQTTSLAWKKTTEFDIFRDKKKKTFEFVVSKRLFRTVIVQQMNFDIHRRVIDLRISVDYLLKKDFTFENGKWFYFGIAKFHLKSYTLIQMLFNHWKQNFRLKRPPKIGFKEKISV